MDSEPLRLVVELIPSQEVEALKEQNKSLSDELERLRSRKVDLSPAVRAAMYAQELHEAQQMLKDAGLPYKWIKF